LKLLLELRGSSLVKLALLPEKMAQLLVNLHVEEERYPQGDSPVFLLRIPD
jgi:hypothetical protein